MNLEPVEGFDRKIDPETLGAMLSPGRIGRIAHFGQAIPRFLTSLTGNYFIYFDLNPLLRQELLHFRSCKNKFTQLMNRTTFSSILFDFDGTLTSIDGMEFLAELQNLTNEFDAITGTFRNTFSVTSDLYEKRMDLLHPQRSHLKKLIEAYRKHLVPGAVRVCEILQWLGKEIYILSGGIHNAIVPIGKILNIRPDHIFGVEVYFNPEGRFTGYDSESPLTNVTGKKEIILSLTPTPPIAFIGDGSNDVAAREVVHKFIGYGGAEYRPPIEEACETYISDPDLTSVLPEILTTAELRRVQEHYIQYQAKAHFKIEEE